MISRNVGKLTIIIFFAIYTEWSIWYGLLLLYLKLNKLQVDFSYTKKIDNKFKLKFKDCLKKFFLHLITHLPAHLIFKKLYTINFSISEILQKICQKSATLPVSNGQTMRREELQIQVEIFLKITLSTMIK